VVAPRLEDNLVVHISDVHYLATAA
jgi:hypothetical protein